jgi:site-specific DNA recombinase
VWQEVCTLLAHPEQLAEEYRRRLQPQVKAKHHEHTALEGQLGKLRQGLARLIDSYAEGLIDKQEFEPRITRLRQRIEHLETQCHQLADEAAFEAELRVIIGRLEDFAARVKEGLEDVGWDRKREIIRTLVKRVDVARDQVQVVFRVDQYYGNPGPEKKGLQLCRESSFALVGQHRPEPSRLALGGVGL